MQIDAMNGQTVTAQTAVVQNLMVGFYYKFQVAAINRVITDNPLEDAQQPQWSDENSLPIWNMPRRRSRERFLLPSPCSARAFNFERQEPRSATEPSSDATALIFPMP